MVTPSGPGGSIGGASGGGGSGASGAGSSANLTVSGSGGAGGAGAAGVAGGAGGSTSPMRRQSSARGLETLVPPGRSGSFRGRNSPINPTSPDKPSFSMWKRRPSWPEVEIKSSSG